MASAALGIVEILVFVAASEAVAPHPSVCRRETRRAAAALGDRTGFQSVRGRWAWFMLAALVIGLGLSFAALLVNAPGGKTEKQPRRGWGLPPQPLTLDSEQLQDSETTGQL